MRLRHHLSAGPQLQTAAEVSNSVERAVLVQTGDSFTQLDAFWRQLSTRHDFVPQRKHKRVHQLACDMSAPAVGLTNLVRLDAREWDRRMASTSQFRGKTHGHLTFRVTPLSLIVASKKERNIGHFHSRDTAVGKAPQTIQVAPRHHNSLRFAVNPATTCSWSVMAKF